jgi:hypothetical protein
VLKAVFAEFLDDMKFFVFFAGLKALGDYVNAAAVL